MNNKRVQRTNEELLAAIDHISYELLMVAQCAVLLRDRPTGVIANALLESELIHARQLIDFLLRDGRGTDILRRDFHHVDWPKDQRPTEETARLLDHHGAINHYLAHLTWHRVGDAPDWEYDNIAEDIVVVARAWKTYLGSRNSKVAQRFMVVWAETALSRDPAPKLSATTNTSFDFVTRSEDSTQS